MKRLMLAAAAGLLFVAPAAQAAPPAPKAQRPTRVNAKRAPRKAPKKATAGDKAGQAAANALANLCPATITCNVGQQPDVVLHKTSGPTKARTGGLACSYQARSFEWVPTRRTQCKDVPVSLRTCKGYNKRIISAYRGSVSYQTGTARDGKCKVKPGVRLATK